MDISVSRINNRLSLHLPAELPLGLVFVVGQVENVTLPAQHQPADKGKKYVWFDLIEHRYRLRCTLSPRAAAEVQLVAGDQIRAGGHLIFDPRGANYFLLARDVTLITPESTAEEILPATTDRAALTKILADIKKRSDTAHLAPADLPDWVQRMAPPEVRAELGYPVVPETNIDESPVLPAPDMDNALDEQLVSFLSAAMEDLEDVEITPDLLGNSAPDRATSAPEAAATTAVAASAAVPDTPAPDWLTWTLWIISGIAILVLCGLLLLIALS